MTTPDDPREWPLHRRLELQGRMGWLAMDDPAEAVVASVVGRRQLRQMVWVLLATIVAMIAWVVSGRSLDAVLVVWLLVEVGLIVQLRRGIAANDQVVADARRQNGSPTDEEA